MDSAQPVCPLCGQQMIRRTARRGQQQGSDFWGCPKFPKCRGTIYDNNRHKEQSGPDSKLTSNKNALGARGAAQSRNSNPNEPDADGWWKPDERREVLRHVYDRDGGLCGVCGRELQLKGAQIDHVVPQVFGYFSVQKGGKAKIGSYYKSKLHDYDNLQAAHPHCNKNKGNKKDIRAWRHPTMPPLKVAATEDGQEFVVPWKKPMTS